MKKYNTSIWEEGWAHLESTGGSPSRGEFRVFNTTFDVVDGPVLLALDGKGLRHLLVPVASNFQAIKDLRSGGVHLITRTLVDEFGERLYLDLACQKNHLNDVFVYLAGEVLNILRQNTGQPLVACRQTLQRWRELLEREVPNIMSLEALCGLYGELWHLQEIAAKNAEGIFSWHGPNGSRHDFATKGLALEVKTTMRRDGWQFRVHGLTQLEQPTDARLFLSAIRLEVNGAAGNTVPDVIRSILDLGVDRHELLTRLSSVDYHVHDETYYGQHRFHVHESRVFEVEGVSVPRLTTATFGLAGPPSGISDIHYTIDLAASSAVAVQPEMLDQLHVAFAGVCDAGTAGSPI